MKVRYLSKMVCEIDVGNPSKEELDNILEELKMSCVPSDIQYDFEWRPISETSELVKPEENIGEPTVVVLDDDGGIMYSNQDIKIFKEKEAIRVYGY